MSTRYYKATDPRTGIIYTRPTERRIYRSCGAGGSFSAREPIGGWLAPAHLSGISGQPVVAWLVQHP